MKWVRYDWERENSMSLISCTFSFLLAPHLSLHHNEGANYQLQFDEDAMQQSTNVTNYCSQWLITRFVMKSKLLN